MPGVGDLKCVARNLVLIFVAIDPITILPIFATFTKGLNKKDLNSVFESTLTAFGILLLFFGYLEALYFKRWESISILLELLEVCS